MSPHPMPFALPLPDTPSSPSSPLCDMPELIALPLPEVERADIGAEMASPTDVHQLHDRQASIVTQTIMASTGLSAPSSSTSATSSNQSQGFPFAVAIPALVGGMALACLGALAWWWLQRRRRREQRKRWEARQRRQQRKRNAANGRRGSFSSTRTGGTMARTLIKEKEKDLDNAPPVPPMPALAYGQQSGYQYGGNPNGQQDAYANGNPVQPGIDGYGNQGREIIDEKSLDRSYADQYLSMADSTSPNPDVSSPDFNDDERDSQPQQTVTEKEKSSSKASRSAKRVEAAENAAARESANPMSRWKPNKPSPLALAAEKKKAEAAAAAASGGRAPPLSAGANSNFEYEEELTTPNDPYAGYADAMSPDPNSGMYQDARRPSNVSSNGGNSARATSGEWGVAGGIDPRDEIAAQNFKNGGHFANDPYLSVGSGMAAAAAAAAAGTGRLPSGQYTVDPYASYHNRDSGEAAPPAAKVESKKIGGWV